MGVVARNRSFLATAALIIMGGLVVMGMFTVFFAMAESGETAPVAAVEQAPMPVPGSFGITGAETLTIQVTDDTPKPIANALKEQRGIVLLVYLKGASADMAMLDEVKALKPEYAADMSFFTYESGDVKRLGDVLDQLGVYDPPVLAVVRGDGTVSELYTGWVGAKVLEQRIADAARGL
ncbi:MAG: hypothetical protein JW767_07505 [Thermoleophilia bacterium]|jgi:hypothetical protein|nr:hypothetical protein [Thermoleophilia bacterium]